jgi:hypothetical protein
MQLRRPVEALDASNCQVRIRKAVTGRANLFGFEETDLAVNEKIIPAAFPAPPPLVIIDR